MANVNMTQAYKASKPAILNKSFHTPFSGPDGVPEMKGMHGRVNDRQATATDATVKYASKHDGKVRKAMIFVEALPAAGESMQFDILVNGVSILSGTPLVTNADTTTAGWYDILGLVATKGIKFGDVVSIFRDYTAGGGPTPMAFTEVLLEWG